jgi:hypothetical protein
MDHYIAAEDIWHWDAETAAIARQLYPDRLLKSAQYLGSVEPWQAEWLSALPAKPKSEHCDFQTEAILDSAGLGDWSLFVLQVGLWGRIVPGLLGRSYQRIYGSAYGEPVSVATFDTIDSILSRAFAGLHKKQSLEAIWNLLSDELNWSAVMRSHCLHFMARACRMEGIRVPMPLDTAMSRNWLWPQFRQSARDSCLPLPAVIHLDDWSHYNRYMTAMAAWAAALNWTCAELEGALWSHFKCNGVPFIQAEI